MKTVYIFYQTILKHEITYGINIATSIRFLYPPLTDFKPMFYLEKPGSWFSLAKYVKNICGKVPKVKMQVTIVSVC